MSDRVCLAFEVSAYDEELQRLIEQCLKITNCSAAAGLDFLSRCRRRGWSVDTERDNRFRLFPPPSVHIRCSWPTQVNKEKALKVYVYAYGQMGICVYAYGHLCLCIIRFIYVHLYCICI